MNNHYPSNQDKLLEPKQLLRCPFCHSKHSREWTSCIEEDYYSLGEIKLFYVRCNKCGARGPVTKEQNPDIAHKLWNLR